MEGRDSKGRFLKGNKPYFSALFLIFLFLINFISAWNFPSNTNKLTSTTTNYINITNYSETDPIWISDKSDYYTSSEVDDLNTSMKNYVDYVNSTNGAGGSYSDTWINSTIDSKILTQNNSINNWVNNIFVKISNIIDLVGNWSADKTSYYTSSQIEGILANGSFADTDTFVANYSTFITHITYDDVMNGTLKSYFDGLYIGIGAETESKWNANYSQFLLNNDSLTNYIASNNASIENYILYVNSTNGEGGSYDDTWINGTMDSKILTNNDSVINWIGSTFNETRNNEVARQNTSIVNYILVVNTSMKNYVDSQDVIFNTSQNNYLVFNNGSIVNYVASVNESMKNYVDSVAGVYDDTWINDTIDNKITINNNSIINYIGIANTTLYQILNNGSYLNYPWNATNTSYYLASNPNGYYNQSSNIGNWTNDKSTYTLLSVLNNGSYLNPASADTFAANYSTFLTHITWAEAMNGTLAKSSELNNGSYWNTDTFVTNYSQFLLNNQSLSNYIVSTNLTTLNILNNGSYLNIAETDSLAYNGTLVSIAQLNNGSYLNTADWSNIINGTIWSWVMNGTIAKSSELNNGSYLNIDESDPIWIEDKLGYYTSSEVDDINTSLENYILYVNSTNGAGGSYSDTWINDTIDAKILIQNTSLVNYIKVQNDSLVNYVGIGNTSLKNYMENTFNDTRNNYLAFVNLSMKNYVIDYTAGINTSMKNYVADVNLSMKNYVLYVNSTNGAGSGTDSFVANYSTFLTHIDWSKITNGSIWSWVNNGTIWSWAMNGTLMQGSNFTLQNISMQNYIGVQNTSVKNYADSTMTAQNTSQTNYINMQNTSVTNTLNTKLNLAGGTMTGNITLTNSGVRLANGTANTAVIYHNGTGWVIKG